jgi:hypothetical protein
VASTSYSSSFAARFIFTLEEDVSRKNYWLAENGKAEGQGFTIELGSTPANITGIRLKNCHNAGAKDRATKKFRLLGGLAAEGPWTALLERSLEDSRQQASPPVQELLLDQPAEVRFLKFELVEFWGAGGGLQFFDTTVAEKGHQTYLTDRHPAKM